jgi:hypothetical protein
MSMSRYLAELMTIAEMVRPRFQRAVRVALAEAEVGETEIVAGPLKGVVRITQKTADK